MNKLLFESKKYILFDNFFISKLLILQIGDCFYYRLKHNRVELNEGVFMSVKFSIVLLFCLFTLNAQAAWPKSLYWSINNNSWDESFELGYQDFIHTIGLARKNGFCKTADECLRSPKANPKYAAKNPKKLKFIYTDCADLPYIFRAYYAWMNNLPFAYTTELVEATTMSPKLSDIRYSKNGNLITGKREVRNGDNINNILQNLTDTISSATYRTDANKYDLSKKFRDTYPVAIDRKAIVPGSILYDPNGHVAIVYEVGSNGKIRLIDAHPDNSLSVITYGEKFARSKIQIGGGFSNFRPLNFYNDTVYPKSNKELPTYSIIQYQKEPFIFKGKEVSFYEYVRSVLADGAVIYQPIIEFTDSLIEICQDVLYRRDAVDVAIEKHLDDSPHPERLPKNIYGADGDWEMYATPARDARLKASFRELKLYVKKVLNSFEFRLGNIDYDGSDLKSDLRKIYLDKMNSCKFELRSGEELSMDFVLKNIFKISFDPYHCEVLRWGITDLNKCKQTTNKWKWYEAEQGLRNRIDRDNTIKTDYSVDELANAPESKVDQVDLSFDKVLDL